MAVGFDNSSSSKVRQRNKKKGKGNGNTSVVQTKKSGQFLYVHQHQPVIVVALFCDCGRYILVRPKDVKEAPIICSLCNSSFSWQQLSFALD
jgi:hypothetical protein